MKVDEYVAALGPRRARNLAWEMGGVQLYVSSRIAGDRLLRELIGADGVDWLLRERRGETIEVPSARAMELACARIRAGDMLAAGESDRAVARDTGLSRRTVARIRRRRGDG